MLPSEATVDDLAKQDVPNLKVKKLTCLTNFKGLMAVMCRYYCIDNITIDMKHITAILCNDLHWLLICLISCLLTYFLKMSLAVHCRQQLLRALMS